MPDFNFSKNSSAFLLFTKTTDVPFKSDISSSYFGMPQKSPIVKSPCLGNLLDTHFPQVVFFEIDFKYAIKYISDSKGF